MNQDTGTIIGILSLMISVSSSVYLLFHHLMYFRCPEYQLYICRIILMVPIYCFTSCLSIIYPNSTEYFSMIRDFYEAFVIYSFTMLLINYIGGERRLSISFELKDHIRHPWPLNYLFRSFKPGGVFVRLVKLGVLQFVMFRPLLSFLSIILTELGLSHEDTFHWKDGFLYIFILSNISFTLALYGLILFYVTAEELLEPFKPLPKFLCIKGVIFFSYWQGIALLILQNLGFLGASEEMTAKDKSNMYQNTLVCIEMVIASFAHYYAFPYNEFESDCNSTQPINRLTTGIKSILSAQDVINQVKDSISPQSYDFELKYEN